MGIKLTAFLITVGTSTLHTLQSLPWQPDSPNRSRSVVFPFYCAGKELTRPTAVCPVTTSILERVPVAGRIAGFNRQAPNSGIPLHSDGNNMWLTCQMGIDVPSDESAWIRVGSEKAHWKNGHAIVYDTTVSASPTWQGH